MKDICNYCSVFYSYYVYLEIRNFTLLIISYL